jgi:lysophospholipase L1-like esterase
VRDVLVTLILVASVSASVALTLATRHYYTLWKQASLQPTFEGHYRASNASVLASSPGALLVLFGDSRVRQWSPPPDVAGLTVFNRGIDGETTTQMMYRFKADVLGLNPSVVIIQAGINDLVAEGLSSQRSSSKGSQVVVNLECMVDQANRSGIRVVLLTVIPPASPGLLRWLVWSPRIAQLVTAVNHDLMRLHDPPRVYVLDTKALLRTSSGEWEPNVMADTLHLTPAGYKVLNAAVQDVLARY